MGITEITLSCVIIRCLMWSSTACFICCKCGSFSPNDPYYFINDTSTMICALDKPHHSVNASDLFIVFNNVEVDPSYLTILNESAVLFNKPMKLEDDGKYYCHKRGVEGVDGLIGGQSVIVDYQLEPINDIECIWHNWIDRLVCRWTLPPYRYKYYINVELTMYNGALISCHNMVNKTECTWTPEDGSLDMYQGDFQLKVTNTNPHKNMTKVGPWIMKIRDENVKPHEVNSFTQNYTNESTCLLLTWKYDPNITDSREKHYRVQYAAVGDPSQKNTLWSVNDNVTVCGLTPYTLYKFTIAVHPDRNATKGYWSDPVTKEFQTDQDVPGAAPEMVGFRQHSESCTQKEKTTAGITSTIYFKSIPEVERNGLITSYRVNYTDLSDGAIVTKVIVNKNTTSVSHPLPCNKLYNISISAATVKGYSPHHSSLIINTSGMTPADVMVERKDLLYNVSWTVPGPVDLLTSYRVVYCTMFGSQQECAGELQKVIVPDSRTRHQTLPLTLDTMYLFGVSIVRAGVASAAKFESCIYVSTESKKTI
ncbi:receptor-type tyrosine-protein phosphatase F-like [Mizuhopecten yessoensis]|uniref:receptor-type tyrosine-protein phosphatase F-like n=1 Tax=Mizuhopecten yessoensis TaxID=6573 RepID=UPI000B45C0E6|nr:receptor-type tyrosine-protein phosphatase F-like [Mizuhopecten yessoensis]